MLELLTRPIKKRCGKYRDKLTGFIAPVKDSVSKLKALIPKGEAFAGSEDLAEDSHKAATGKKPGLLAKLKDFKKSLKGLSDFQKLILLTIAVVLPAGILIAFTLAKFLRRKK